MTMKTMVLGAVAVAAATAFGELKIGTVDMMTLVRNHSRYESDKKLLTDTEKDYQRKLDEMKSNLESIQDEGKAIADKGRNPMLGQAAKDKIEKELIDVQNRYIQGQQKLRAEAMESQQKLQELEGRLMRATTEELRKTINGFAEKNGYDLILESTVAAFAKPSLNVTDAILKEMGVDPKEAKKKDESK